MSRVQLALRVPDLDASVAFYSKPFGAEPASTRLSGHVFGANPTVETGSSVGSPLDGAFEWNVQLASIRVEAAWTRALRLADVVRV